MPPVPAGSPIPVPIPRDSTGWQDALIDAFEDPDRASGFLPLAEEALLAHPGNPVILCLAATAALLDARPDRAQVFLKRYTKRFVPTGTNHLLNALTLAEQGKLGAARTLLERHSMIDLIPALRSFPAGWARHRWLVLRFNRIMGREKPARRPRATAAATRSPVKPANKAHKPASAPPAPAPPAAAAVAPPGLPRLDIDIPFAVDLDLTALAAAARGEPEPDGRLYHLRERFAHLGLAQGFDELLCLPHLRGIETLLHQIETVRKVLKQFRGRVLLADEVGLGKTIEAGMVLKEYLLRGMAERCWSSRRLRWSANGAKSWRPNSVLHSRPPTTRCCATSRMRFGPRIASSPRSRSHAGASTPSA